jgi:hypothetical protein
MNLLIKTLIALSLSILNANLCFSAHEVRIACPDTPITFVYDHPVETRCLCTTTTAAVAFLKSLGLEIAETMTIRLVEHLQDLQQNDLFGAYNAKTREVSILTYAKLAEYSRNEKMVLGIPFNEDVWCSFAAHELAHAISEPFLGRQMKDHVDGEYISVVTQLWVLSPETREKVLAAFKDVEPYESREEMSLLYYLIAPDRFSVKCYLHFLSLKNPAEFIERLIQHNH